MNYTIKNLTDEIRVENPKDGDKIQYTYSNGTVVTKNFYAPIAPTQKDIERYARQWRNAELESYDYMVPLADHPNHSTVLTYRQALRDWPNTDAFPDTKPTL
jgi:hypothetical protein